MGARSVLYGAHCFFLHPIFVAIAWTELYGFPLDPRLWVAFIVHDWGYLFQWCPNIDGPEGESHPEFGAKIMGFLFGKKWENFSLCHSRSYARKINQPFSRLCVADKLAIATTPAWIYIPMCTWTGELKEYMANSSGDTENKYNKEPKTDEENRLLKTGDPYDWYQAVSSYIRRWAFEHRQETKDTWFNKNA